jgi:hypothetical protein
MRKAMTVGNTLDIANGDHGHTQHRCSSIFARLSSRRKASEPSTRQDEANEVAGDRLKALDPAGFFGCLGQIPQRDAADLPSPGRRRLGREGASNC